MAELYSQPAAVALAVGEQRLTYDEHACEHSTRMHVVAAACTQQQHPGRALDEVATSGGAYLAS
jgi:hypothetical protein